MLMYNYSVRKANLWERIALIVTEFTVQSAGVNSEPYKEVPGALWVVGEVFLQQCSNLSFFSQTFNVVLMYFFSPS